MKKLIITGMSGFLGWNLCQQAKQDWEIYGTYANNFLNIADVKLIRIDLTNLQAVKDLFSTIQPDAIIHLAAKSQPNYCQKYPDESYQINVIASLNLAQLCADANIPCVFTSSDLVFDGLNPPYQESDRVSPINFYGEQKVQAEQGMLERYPQTVICRMPLMFGLASPVAKSFIQPFIQTLREGKQLSLFTDEFRTPVSGSTAAKGLLLALEKGAGIIHLGGKERISRYQFGCIMAEVLNLPKQLITTCLQKDIPLPAPRPSDVSLDSSKAFSLGYQPLSLKEELTLIKNQI